METQKKSLWQLFIRTFKIGALTWGGGYVIIPLLKTEFADKCRYIEESEIIDMVAVSHITVPARCNQRKLLLDGGIQSTRSLGSAGCSDGRYIAIYDNVEFCNIFLFNVSRQHLCGGGA